MFPTQLEVFGETWSAPLLSIKAEDISGTFEKELTEKEWQLKKAKAGKKRAADTLASGSSVAQGQPVVDVENDVWEVPSEDEAPRAKGGTSKTPKTSGKDDAAVAARKAAREREAAWKKELSKATRVIASLNSVCSSMTTCMDKHQKNPGLLSEDLVKSLSEASAKLTSHKLRS